MRGGRPERNEERREVGEEGRKRRSEQRPTGGDKQYGEEGGKAPTFLGASDARGEGPPPAGGFAAVAALHGCMHTACVSVDK